jgi:DNA-binding NarL/FixJ family response regulator
MQATQSESQQIISLLKRLVRNTDRIASAMEQQSGNSKRSSKPSKDERVALAVVAIAKGASSFQEIADQLGVSRGTISNDPVIRRAMESEIRDRRPASKECADDFYWDNQR